MLGFHANKGERLADPTPLRLKATFLACSSSSIPHMLGGFKLFLPALPHIHFCSFEKSIHWTRVSLIVGVSIFSHANHKHAALSSFHPAALCPFQHPATPPHSPWRSVQPERFVLLQLNLMRPTFEWESVRLLRCILGLVIAWRVNA